MTAPVGLFLLVAYLPGDLGTINLFEEGQILAGAEIVRDGAFPWRDILVVHGLLHDIGTGLFGSAVIEDSRWGVVAGEKLLILPLSWVALYYLCAYLFWSNWLFLLGSQILVVTGSLFVVHYRLGLIPLVLLLLAALFHRPTVIRAVAFTCAPLRAVDRDARSTLGRAHVLARDRPVRALLPRHGAQVRRELPADLLIVASAGRARAAGPSSCWQTARWTTSFSATALSSPATS